MSDSNLCPSSCFTPNPAAVFRTEEAAEEKEEEKKKKKRKKKEKRKKKKEEEEEEKHSACGTPGVCLIELRTPITQAVMDGSGRCMRVLPIKTAHDTTLGTVGGWVEVRVGGAVRDGGECSLHLPLPWTFLRALASLWLWPSPRSRSGPRLALAFIRKGPDEDY